jgi:hypothetical protein
MHRPQPPDNLPVVPVDFRQPWQKPPRFGPVDVTWGKYEPSPDLLARARTIIEKDRGGSLPYSEDDLRLVVQNALHAVAVLVLRGRVSDQ